MELIVPLRLAISEAIDNALLLVIYLVEVELALFISIEVIDKFLIFSMFTT